MKNTAKKLILTMAIAAFLIPSTAFAANDNEGEQGHRRGPNPEILEIIKAYLSDEVVADLEAQQAAIEALKEECKAAMEALGEDPSQEEREAVRELFKAEHEALRESGKAVHEEVRAVVESNEELQAELEAHREEKREARTAECEAEGKENCELRGPRFRGHGEDEERPERGERRGPRGDFGPRNNAEQEA